MAASSRSGNQKKRFTSMWVKRLPNRNNPFRKPCHASANKRGRKRNGLNWKHPQGGASKWSVLICKHSQTIEVVEIGVGDEHFINPMNAPEPEERGNKSPGNIGASQRA